MFVRNNLKSYFTKLIYLQSLIFLTFLIVIFTITSPYFLTLSNFENILSASTVIGVLALGQTFVIASGGIDLSVASIMALTSTVCAFYIQDSELNLVIALLISLFVGTFAGLVNGLLINLTKAPSFIVTLGMLSVCRALAYIIADGTPIYGLPDGITAPVQDNFFLISGATFILLIASIITFVMLHTTQFGNHVLFNGDNQVAAKANGISQNWLNLKIYALSGALSGIAGLVFMARTNSGDPTAGQNYELIAITAVILGGAKLFGGEANILGTVIGVFCLGILQNGLNLLAVSTYYQVLFVGLVLIGAAFLNRIKN